MAVTYDFEPASQYTPTGQAEQAGQFARGLRDRLRRGGRLGRQLVAFTAVVIALFISLLFTA